MGFDMRIRVALLIAAVIGWLLVAVLYLRPRPVAVEEGATAASASVTSTATVSPGASSKGVTEVSAHNLMLRKGPDFRFYVRWLNGQMVPTRRSVNPSFDDPDSFYVNIKTGVLRVNIGDLNHYLNTSSLKDSPLKNLVLSGDGDHVTLKATLHKIVALSIQLDGTISIASNNRIQIHATKLSVLKVPFKGLLGGLHISLADLFQPKNVPGVQVVKDDIFFDTSKLLPPPHIRGQLTTVHIVNPDLEEIYGEAQTDVARVEQWRNFIRLREGAIDFGKLTMNHVDLIMIDISKDPWFDIDISNYQAQLVNGYTRMTPQAGLQIFMPDLGDIPKNKTTQNISIEWMKNRNQPAPADVSKSH